MEVYNIRLPNGGIFQKELEKEEAEYWISMAMLVLNGVQALTFVFQGEAQAESLDEEANVALSDEQKSSVN